jgi:hypothetical protein
MGLRSALKAAARRSRCWLLRHNQVALIDGTPSAMLVCRRCLHIAMVPAVDLAKPAQPTPATPARDRHVAIAVALIEHADRLSPADLHHLANLSAMQAQVDKIDGAL